jgi:hypothetical protein
MEEQARYTHNDKPKLNDEKVLSQAKKNLEIFLPLEADGYCVTTDTLYDILIGIAANRGTTESVCAELASAPDPETIRCYFRERFGVEQLQDLQRSINDGLALFRQVRFLNFLKQALERIYGAVNKIRALAAPLL